MLGDLCVDCFRKINVWTLCLAAGLSIRNKETPGAKHVLNAFGRGAVQNTVEARTNHLCDACGEKILSGDTYHRIEDRGILAHRNPRVVRVCGNCCVDRLKIA